MIHGTAHEQRQSDPLDHGHFRHYQRQDHHLRPLLKIKKLFPLSIFIYTLQKGYFERLKLNKTCPK